MTVRKMQSVHVIVGLLDDKAPTRPLICQPFTLPRWLILLTLILFRPAPALFRLRRWAGQTWRGIKEVLEYNFLALLGRVLLPAPVWAVG